MLMQFGIASPQSSVNTQGLRNLSCGLSREDDYYKFISVCFILQVYFSCYPIENLKGIRQSLRLKQSLLTTASTSNARRRSRTAPGGDAFWFVTLYQICADRFTSIICHISLNWLPSFCVSTSRVCPEWNSTACQPPRNHCIDL